ncbi:MAG: FHA domain-containing protein, partial [Anaerolineales bacterium]|nr:FHA domain-containing protein [Anaerolineales bacterium]
LGDLRSQDGVYSAAFYPLENGNYTFIVKARNENGQTAPPDEEYPGFVAVPVDPFTRMAETTVYVEGAAVAPVITATPLPTATPAAAPPAPPPTPAGGLGLGFVFVLLALGGLGVYIATRRRLAGQGVVGTAARLLLPDGQVIQLVDNFVIGRSSLANLHLHDQAVSRRHAILRFSQGGWFVQDQGSSAGTFVNGQPVQAARLYPGDRIQIGSTTVVFQV